VELDHIFIMCAVDAPESLALSRLGLKEGSANTHPGQGTACRRFFFRDSYIELLWVCDQEEAQSELVRRTRLWERWSMRQAGACPFGVVLRAGRDVGAEQAPFRTWQYVPPYLPEGLVLDVALDTPLTEPEFFYLGFQREPTRRGHEPVAHAIPATDLTGVMIGMPAPGCKSKAGRTAEAAGLLSFAPSSEYVLRLTFDQATTRNAADLRPELPLMLEW
jgi:hypothetical protein